MSIIEKNLVWWREVPVDVEFGLVQYLSKNWKGKIYIVSCLGFGNDRKSFSLDFSKYENIQFIYGDLNNPKNQSTINYLLTCPAIHLFSGIKGKQKTFLDKLRSLNPHRNDCVLICESPSAYGNKVKKTIKELLYPVLYGYYNLKYGKMIKAFFLMGYKATLKYELYGWDSNKMFPFMYLPSINAASPLIEAPCSDRIECLYIGRFKYSTKGVDDLIKAIEYLQDPKFHFSFVGGYGENSDEIIKWCNSSKYADYVGSWKQEEVVDMMAGTAALILVPSKYDGWNMAPYQSIYAGIGCIVSDKAGSDELIEFSHSGKVFKAGDYMELANILKEVSNNPTLIQEWKKNSILYRDKISHDVVGRYFIDALRYSFGEISIKPGCPWEK